MKLHRGLGYHVAHVAECNLSSMYTLMDWLHDGLPTSLKLAPTSMTIGMSVTSRLNM
jgi:hypothetical protein